MTVTRALLLLFSLVICAVYLVGLGSFPLTERSEARYVGVAWEMVSGGDYVTPRYNGIKHFHKPPLYYWVTALSMRLLGATEGPARLPCALAALTTLVLTTMLARRSSMGCRHPWLVYGCLATAPFLWEMGRIAVTDMQVTLLAVAGLTAAWQVIDSGPTTGKRTFMAHRLSRTQDPGGQSDREVQFETNQDYRRFIYGDLLNYSLQHQATGGAKR